MNWDGGEDIICGARGRSVECIALLSSKRPRKAAMDSKDIRRLYLLLRPKGRLSPGRKTPPGVSAPSTGLRPLIVSRVKCGGRPYRGHSVIPYVFFELSILCALQRVQTVPAAIHSGRIPPCNNLQSGDGRLSLPLTTPAPDRYGRVLHSQ